MRGRSGTSVVLTVDVERDAGTGASVGQPFDDVVEDRQRLGRGQRHHLAAAFELREEEDLVDQLAGALDLRPCLVDQAVHVGAGQRRVSSKARIRASGVRSSWETAAVKPVRSS